MDFACIWLEARYVYFSLFSSYPRTQTFSKTQSPEVWKTLHLACISDKTELTSSVRRSLTILCPLQLKWTKNMQYDTIFIYWKLYQKYVLNRIPVSKENRTNRVNLWMRISCITNLRKKVVQWELSTKMLIIGYWVINKYFNIFMNDS